MPTSIAWVSICAGAAWVGIRILSAERNLPIGRTLLIILVSMIAASDGCSRIDPSNRIHLGDDQDPYENARGR